MLLLAEVSIKRKYNVSFFQISMNGSNGTVRILATCKINTQYLVWHEMDKQTYLEDIVITADVTKTLTLL